MEDSEVFPPDFEEIVGEGAGNKNTLIKIVYGKSHLSKIANFSAKTKQHVSTLNVHTDSSPLC